ncbi:hypothetical protein UJ101_02611 [Flavobacteriaceae bacterium UJ101]|nr:hypothetical protein UJ101_02611 [Flavobacteriaceae bacterium UJ101]
MGKYKELNLYKESMVLVTRIYQVTDKFPSDEKFGLINQIRRSAISITSNIAEGAGRNSNAQYINFLNISKGSIYELETQITISFNLGYIKKELYEELILVLDKLSKMNQKLQNYLATK